MIKSGRFEQLDSLRGLAALFVMFSHFMITSNNYFQETYTAGFYQALLKYSPIHIFWAGHEAVMFFFILSGFVLTLPFLGGKTLPYSEYIIKRFFRIYIPCIFSILLAIFLKSVVFGDSQTNSTFINSNWTVPTTIENIFEHLFLIGYFKHELNPVLWSLVYEMRISIIFPLIVFLVIHFKWQKAVISAVCLSLTGFVLGKIYGADHDYFLTLHYASMFILGSLLANYRNYLIELFKNMSFTFKMLVLIIGVHLYTFRWLFYGYRLIHQKIIDEWTAAIGACIIIVISLSSRRFSNVLNRKPIVFFGKISYSLYLSHFIFLLFFMKYFGGQPVAILLTLAVSLIFSTITYYLIEKPSMKIGKKVAGMYSLHAANVSGIFNKKARRTNET